MLKFDEDRPEVKFVPIASVNYTVIKKYIDGKIRYSISIKFKGKGGG